ncbi:GntR family transcriptional regulator [Rhodococcus koreensis]
MTTVHNMTLHRTSTAQQVADGLTEAIMRGELTPGSPIKESGLATSLGISRNTVREAVRILEMSGLVRYTMHHGFAVVDPSQDDLLELYRARLALEISAVRIPRTPDELAPVRSALEALMKAYKTKDPAEIAARDLDFHAAIVGMLNSKRINAFYGQLAKELRYFLMVLSLEEREFESQTGVIEEHQSIMAALESGDSAHAVDVLTEVLTVNADKVLAIFANRAAATE